MVKLLTFGGWYQRTTLHLTEVFKFLKDIKSDLDLNQNKLNKFHENLDIKSVKRVAGYLEHIEVITNSKIKIKYYEDGLYILQKESNNIEIDSKNLKEYFNKKWKPATSYLFSLGAPTPKILSNMKDNHPIVVGDIIASPRKTKLDEKIYGKAYSETLSRNAHVFKTKDYIVTYVSKMGQKDLEPLIEMQIFFREFKLQLHKYLNIHRKIWEEISAIKEKKSIKGSEADKYRSMLDSYQKTIMLIENRINQMGAYAKTRASLSKRLGIESNLVSHFEYKYEDLFNSLEYIKEVWKMTLDYVESAIAIIKEVKTKTTTKGIKSIQLLLSVGAVAGIVRLMNPKYIPKIDATVAVFMIGLFGVSYAIDAYLKYRAKSKEYKLKFKERAKDI